MGARQVTLADLRRIAARNGWLDMAGGEPDQALLVLATDDDTTVIHIVDRLGTITARAVTRATIPKRNSHAEAPPALPAASRSMLTADGAVAVLCGGWPR